MVSVDRDHHGWALEAFESGDRAVEVFFGRPRLLPVGAAVGVASLGVDRLATLGDEWSDAFE